MLGGSSMAWQTSSNQRCRCYMQYVRATTAWKACLEGWDLIQRQNYCNASIWNISIATLMFVEVLGIALATALCACSHSHMAEAIN
eukprot:505786-Amphidinium_carterae.1